ncbi:EipB family protein [Acetobacter sp. LMG 32666]|uniref:EipB family protein n=1 Tax=Acetobacter sp. LMG 32666 TaxID=2959295 RepID=UPI0030C8A3E1
MTIRPQRHRAALLAAFAPASLALAFALHSPCAQAATPTSPLVSQQAVYDLGLVEAAGGQTLSATGRMTYAVLKTCLGWSSRQRLDIQSVTRKQGEEHLLSDYAAQESLDGRHLTFKSQETRNGKVLRVVSGEASLAPDGSGVVQYRQPLAKTLKLPAGTLFPVTHTAAILAAAQKGEKELVTPLFDGTLPDGPEDTYVTLLHWAAPPTSTPYQPLQKLGSGFVHIAFYDRNAHTMMPEYEMGMRYFANGVSDQLHLDFGDFKMQGTLSTLNLPPTPTCTQDTAH